MSSHKITAAEAAAILGVSPQFVRVGLQSSRLPIGTAVKMSTKWAYYISEPQLAAFSGKDIQRELERIRQDAATRTA